MTQIIKIDDTTVAEVGQEEVRRIYGATQLARRKERLEAELVKVNELLDALKAK